MYSCLKYLHGSFQRIKLLNIVFPLLDGKGNWGWLAGEHHLE